MAAFYRKTLHTHKNAVLTRTSNRTCSFTTNTNFITVLWNKIRSVVLRIIPETYTKLGQKSDCFKVKTDATY